MDLWSAHRMFAYLNAQCADSRIQPGWHFRYAADVGLALGRRVTKYLLDNNPCVLEDG